MKTTLYAAVSANGMIAGTDGSEEFLSDDHWETFCTLAKQTGNIIVGRKTFDAVKQWTNGLSFDALQGVEKVVLSHQADFSPGADYLVASSPEAALALLAAKGHGQALVAGGSQVNAAFASAGLLDEIILSTEPALISDGVPLFAAGISALKLQRSSVRAAANGITITTYEVLK